MAAAAILKNRHISAAVRPILTKFGKMMHFERLDRPDLLAHWTDIKVSALGSWVGWTPARNNDRPDR